MRYCLKIVATIAISTSLAACFNSHRVERDASAAAPINDGPGLQRADRVLVTCPADGAYGSKRYDGSGEEVQRATIGALSLSGHEAIPGPFADRLDQAIEAARSADAPWLVMPRILEWEDRAAEWSARPDRLRIELRLIEVASGRVVDSACIVGIGKVITLGGDHPQDMLQPAFRSWVDSIPRGN